MDNNDDGLEKIDMTYDEKAWHAQYYIKSIKGTKTLLKYVTRPNGGTHADILSTERQKDHR